MANVFLALGSNRGDSWGYLTEALKRINRLPGTEIVAFSPVYFTFPYGVTEQAEFLNMVVRVETILKPLELLDEVKNIEKETGRQQRARWHEREIDIDILLYDDLEFHHPRLNIPHAELLKRDFFILPLLDIESGIKDPVSGIFLRYLEITKRKPYIKGLSKKFFELKNGLICLNEP
ncbi:MAG: 2-amino-4-hydroxy-6-hydroxymethyldihydropteridine diphosphokinase [Ignavibacteriales bacterium]|nr:MAG: 2-amino-4-hydroxy-6-hydroxymethyldihydropteridine diphosphokinase [Ignavibacteriaceae bacterium]MBW7872725.1 2-amino-4-hydroxy-6-hydroxymethyldihydropteridine diphosphokinase [Ignavibacteria bacterium]MCZ2143445.1 2-amino-4-hydroxy-6-hydroxymethyldihydropteridine diphosphokinase [Ignavibacteriales bacterium]OQY73816.1 MAG: 2-amino-4-hydroxy-6-hydroxymethyldihydropteridine diphosphokinase [Ignavibacteriales bacterium UTCHB3]MBV6444322.1 2-amino-4-hydroxy-6-hydroxymethyldihydropteridine p